MPVSKIETWWPRRKPPAAIFRNGAASSFKAKQTNMAALDFELWTLDFT
jgi:hypothetical protein